MVGEYEAVFRSLQAGMNTGKVVLRIGTVRERVGESEGSHVLSGGTAVLACSPPAARSERSGFDGSRLAKRQTGSGTANEKRQLDQTGSTHWSDFAQAADVRSLLLSPECCPERLVASGTRPACSDSLLARQDQLFQRVYGPKARHHAKSTRCPRASGAYMLFSSIAALQGSGQANTVRRITSWTCWPLAGAWLARLR